MFKLPIELRILTLFRVAIVSLICVILLCRRHRGQKTRPAPRPPTISIGAKSRWAVSRKHEPEPSRPQPSDSGRWPAPRPVRFPLEDVEDAETDLGFYSGETLDQIHKVQAQQQLREARARRSEDLFHLDADLGFYSGETLGQIQEAQVQQQLLEARAQRGADIFHRAQLRLSQHVCGDEGGPRNAEQQRLGDIPPGSLQRTNAVRRSRGNFDIRRLFRGARNSELDETSVEDHDAAKYPTGTALSPVLEVAESASSPVGNFGIELSNVAPTRRVSSDQPPTQYRQPRLSLSNTAPEERSEPVSVPSRNPPESFPSVRSIEDFPIRAVFLGQMTSAMGAVCVDIDQMKSETRPWMSPTLGGKQNGTEKISAPPDRTTTPTLPEKPIDDIIIQRHQAVYTGSFRDGRFSTSSSMQAQHSSDDQAEQYSTSSTSLNVSDNEPASSRPQSTPISELSADDRVARLLEQAKKPLPKVQLGRLGNLDGFQPLNSPGVEYPSQRSPPVLEQATREPGAPEATLSSSNPSDPIIWARWPQISGPLNPEGGQPLVVRNPDPEREDSEDSKEQPHPSISSSDSAIDSFGSEWKPLPHN